MSESSRGLKLKVGIFVAAGLAIIAVMAVQFGRLGQGLESFYRVTVELPDAGGILKGSDVLLSGARIGAVTEKPVLGENIQTVRVVLSIREDVPLPRETRFTVGSSGLLGDRFIQTRLPDGFDSAKFDSSDPAQRLRDGEVVAGQRQSGGISDLAAKGGEAVGDLRVGLAKIQAMTDRLNAELLSPQNLDNLSATLANLKTTSENFSSVSQDLAGVVEKIDTVATGAQQAVRTADETLNTADQAAEDLRGAIADARGVLRKAQDVVADARQGPGLVNALLNDRALTENLRALVENLRKHGILFYRDSARRVRPAQALDERGTN